MNPTNLRTNTTYDPSGKQTGYTYDGKVYKTVTRKDANGADYTGDMIDEEATSMLGSIKPNTVPPPAVVTSKTAKEQVNKDMNALSSANPDSSKPEAPPGYRAVRVGNGWSTVPIGSSADVIDQMRQNGATQEQMNNALSGSLGSPIVDKTTPNQPVIPTPPKTPTQIALEQTQTELKTLADKVSSTSKNTIDQITKTYDSLIEEQRVANQNYEGAVTLGGIRSGRSRYAPAISAGENKDAVDQGISAIEKLQAKKQSLITQAEQARNDEDFKRLNALMGSYQKTIDDERTQSQNLFNNMVNWSEEIRAQTKERREAASQVAKDIAGSVASILGNNEEENQKIINDAAAQYGIDPNVLMGQVQEVEAKDLTTGIKEYNFAKSQGYKGSFIQYDNAQRAASRASNSPSTLSSSEANRYGLPKELVGMSDAELIQDLSVSKVPTWFKTFKKSETPEANDAQIKAEWDVFRTAKDLDVYKTVGQGNDIKNTTTNNRGPLF